MTDQDPAAFIDAIALPAARGRYARKSAETTITTYVRDLTEADLPDLLLPQGNQGNIYGKTGLQKLRHTHHYTAILLAQGAPRAQVAALTGYSPGTITSLQADPMFQELVEHYRSQTAEEMADFSRRAAALGLSFLDELQQRLEDKPEEFKTKELISGAEMLLDRTVLPSKANTPPPAPPNFSMNIQFVEAPPDPQSMTLDQAPSRPKQLVK